MSRLKLTLRVIGALVLLGVILWLTGTFEPAPIEPGVVAGPPGHRAPQHVGQAERVQLPVWYEAVGTLDSTMHVNIAPRISGQIMALHADVGQLVQSGELLAELDDRDLRAHVEQARSAVLAAQAGAEEASAGLDRTRRLVERGATTAETLERAQALAARARAQLSAAQEQLAEATIGLGYARITSPATGVVQSRPAEPGAIAAPGMTLFSIHDPSSLRIEAAVRQGVIDRVEVGQQLPVVVANRAQPLEAIVREIVPSADPTTRTILVRAELTDSQGLFPGMFGRLRLELDARPVVLVPEAAVRRVGQLHTILTRQGQRWTPRYVTLGQVRAGQREVLSGLEGGETIGWTD